MTEIAAGILGGLLVFALILTLSVYRKWKIEQEIEGLLWKINPECLQNYPRLHPCPSKQSLGSLMSGEVRIMEFLKCDFYREDFYNFCVYVLEDLEIFSNNFQSFLHMRTDWKGALRIAFNSFAIISKIHGQG